MKERQEGRTKERREEERKDNEKPINNVIEYKQDKENESGNSRKKEEGKNN